MPQISFEGKARSFWAKMLNRESLVFLFLFIMSAAIWVLMALNEVYEKENVKIPVKLVNVPSNVILLDNEEDTVVVSVRANGNAFLYHTFNPIEPIKVEFAQYKQEGKVVLNNNELQKLAAQHLNSGVKITAIKNDGLSFRYNFGEHKRVPVRFKGRIGAKTDIEVLLKPDSVDVYALSDQLALIKEIRTVDDSITVKEETTEYFNLEKMKGVKCKPAGVKVTIKPIIFVENTKEVIVECINEPANKRLRLFPPRVSVVYMVDMMKHNLVEPDMFKVVVDYEEAVTKKDAKCKFKLLEYPSFVKNVRLSSEGTSYLIEER